MCLRQQQTPSCLKHKAQQNTAEQHSWIHTSGLEVKGLLSHLDASRSLPLLGCPYLEWNHLHDVETDSHCEMYKIFHFVVQGEANLQYL